MGRVTDRAEALDGALMDDRIIPLLLLWKTDTRKDRSWSEVSAETCYVGYNGMSILI